MQKLVKTAVAGLLKDEQTGMIVNRNVGEYELMKKRRSDAREMSDLKKRIVDLELRIAALEDVLRR